MSSCARWCGGGEARREEEETSPTLTPLFSEHSVNMKAPETRSDITSDWIEYILNDYENRCEAAGSASVSVRDFKIMDGSKDGDGFVGDIVNLVVQATIIRKSNNEECSQDTDYNLVVKLANQNPNQQYFFEQSGFYIREHLMYKSVIPELNKFQKDHANDAYRIDMPKYIYSKCEKGEFVLVLENLKSEGFNMHPNNINLELSEVKLIINQLARLHAVSYAYDKSFKILNKFPDFCNTYYHRYMNYFETPSVIDMLVDILKQMKGEEILAGKLKDMKPILIKKAMDLHHDSQTHKVLCLNHADPHSKNILFKHKILENGSREIDCVKILDWQMVHWNTPILDLQYMISTSTTPEFRKTHLGDILHHYHNNFTEITEKLGAPVSDWTYDLFQTEYFKLHLFGFVKGIYINSLQSRPVAKRTKDRERGEIKSSMLWKFMMYNLTRLMVSFITTSPVNSFVIKDLTWRLQPLIDDILSGQEPALWSKIHESTVEADEMGLFD